MQEQTCQNAELNMTDDQTVERVAKDIYNAHSNTGMMPECSPNWEDFPDHHYPWIAAARAAIAAMPDTKALEAADRLADQLDDGINHYDAPQLLRDALSDYREARGCKL